MKKLKLTILTAFMLSGMFFTQNSQAQTNPCGWTLVSNVCQPNCFESCDGSIVVTPDIVLPNVVYNWASGSNSSQQYNLCAEEYVVTVTDANGCSQTFTYDIIDPAPLVASCITTANESAPGAADGSITASVVGGYGPYEFEWQTNPIQYGAVLSGLTAGTYTVNVYDEKKCMTSTSCEVVTDELACGGFRTQTQGGWGQCHQNGNNPGTYLFANFDAAFPGDLTIGCGTRTLTLTSAQAVCDFLPSGTTPRILNAGAMVDPSQTYRNVFAGQLVAATLNARFDFVDPNFGASGVTLGDLEIASGPFAGWSVNALIAEANRKIGGCASAYTPSQLSSALDRVNNNYVDGTLDNGFLVCPSALRMQAAGSSEKLSVSVYPNPVSGNGSISLVAVQDDVLEVEVYNVAGQKTVTLFKGAVKSQESINLNLDAASMESGIYFIKVISSSEVLTQKFIVNN